jgi:uncharacterized protein (DUF2384 family)
MAKTLDRALLKQALQDRFPDGLFERWMDTPNKAFGGKRPRMMIRTTTGRERLWHMLKQIESGSAD